MNKIKKISVISLVISVILMIWGIGSACYYIDNLAIRSISVFLLVISTSVMANTVKLIFKENK